MVSKVIPMALSLFSLSCNPGRTVSPSQSCSVFACSLLRDVLVVEVVISGSSLTFSLHVKGCLDLGVDVV